MCFNPINSGLTLKIAVSVFLIDSTASLQSTLVSFINDPLLCRLDTYLAVTMEGDNVAEYSPRVFSSVPVLRAYTPPHSSVR